MKLRNKIGIKLNKVILSSIGIIGLLGINKKEALSQTFYQCMPCKAGEYSTGDGRGCQKCPQGSYSDHSQSTSCTRCKEGYYNEGTGNTKCDTPCPKGHYCTAGYKYECANGDYQDNIGQSSCKQIEGSITMWFGYGSSYYKCNYHYYSCMIQHKCSHTGGGCDGWKNMPSNAYCALGDHREGNGTIWDPYHRKLDSAWNAPGLPYFYVYCNKITGKMEFRGGKI